MQFSSSLTCTGSAAVSPVKQLVQVHIGEIAVLEVFATGFPPLERENIRWRKGNNGTTFTTSNKRIFPANFNMWLVVRNLSIEDRGIYYIDIVREYVEASTHIEVRVFSKY